MLRNWALALRPSLSLDFLAGLNDSRITYSGGTNGTVVNSAGVITPVTRTNLLTYSQEFDNAAWTKSNATVTANAVTSPDGTTNADKLVEALDVAQVHFVTEYVTIVSGGVYTASFFAKAAERTKGRVAFLVGGASGVFADFDFSNGTVLTAATAFGGGTAVGQSIESFGNGWYRATVTGSGAAGVSGEARFELLDAAGARSYNGDGTSGMYPWGAQLEAGSSATAYIPTTTAAVTVTDSGRFDYDPVTLAARGLLVEEARTNLLLRSSELDNGSWTKFGATIGANAVTSPDGTANADKIIESALNEVHGALQTVIKAGSAITYTFSFYALQAGRTSLQVNIDDGAATGVTARFDIASGAVSSAPATYGGGTPFTNSSAFVFDAGGGWFRCVVTTTTNTTLAVVPTVILFNGSATYLGNGTSGAYCWGAQIEAGSFPTSYIPTTSASVTRAADSAVMTGTNFSSWFNSAEGTFVVGFDTVEADAIPGNVFEVGDGTFNERMNAFVSSTPAVNFAVTDGGIQLANFSTGSYTVGTVAKVAASYALNNFAGSLNGGTPGTDASGTIPTVNALYIGTQGAGGASLNGHIRSIVFYPSRLSNEQLPVLTS